MRTTFIQSVRGNRHLPFRGLSLRRFRAVPIAFLWCALLGSVHRIHAQQNTPPVISAIPDQVTEEDTPLLAIPFTVWDAETPADQLRVSGEFDLPPMYGPGSVVIGGTGTNRWLSLFAPLDVSGSGGVIVIVSDASGLSASTTFNVTIRPVNDPPWLSAIPDQAALKGQGLFNVPFSAWDVESSSRINIRAWSSRQGVVRDSVLRIVPGSSVSNRVLQVTLDAQGGAGSTAITIQADDHQDTNRVSFILNVTEPQFVRAGQGILATQLPQNFQLVWGDFNGDGLLDLVVSPTQILMNNGAGALIPGIQLPDIMYIIPVAPADFDGDGKLDLLLLGSVMRLLRNNGGNPPTFSEVPLPGGAAQFGSKAFWADVDGDGDLDIMPASPSGGTIWLRNDGLNGFANVPQSLPVNFVGTVLAVGDFDNDGDPDLLVAGKNTVPATLQLLENDGTGRFQPAPISLPQAFTRAAGWADVDGDGLLDLWLVQSPSSQSSSNSLVVLRQTPPDRLAETFRLNFATPFSSSGAATNLAWADFDNDGFVDFAGPFFVPPQPGIPATNYTVVYRNDGAGRFTTTGLSASQERGQPLSAVADFNDDGSADLLYRNGSALMLLRNQAHALNSLPGTPSGLRALVADNLVTLFWNRAHDANQTAPLTYNVRIGTAPGRNDVVPSMSTTNGARMVAAPGNAGFNTWMVLNLPFDQLNVETLYWSVQAVDANLQGGPFAAEQSFYINPPGNTPPTIIGIRDLSFPEDTTTNLVFYVSDDRTPTSGLQVQATSSNPTVISQSGMHLSDFTATDHGLPVRLSLTPHANQFGNAIITITATDRGGLSSSRFLVATVTPANDPPTITAAGTLLGLAGAPTPPLPIQVSDVESAADRLVVTARSLTPNVVPDSNLTLAHASVGDWTLVVTPATSEPTQAQIELTVMDPQGAHTGRSVNVIFQPELLTSFASLPATAGLPNGVIWADVNGDHVPELILGNAAGWGLTVHSVQSGGLPIVAQLTPPMTYAIPVDVGDFDNDGAVDLLADISPPTETRRLIIFRNLGNFKFEQVPSALFDPGAAQFADFDQDGRLDVWVAGDPTNLVVYRNNGSGFDPARPVELIAPAPPELEDVMGLGVIDLDGDGVPELILSRYGYLSGATRQTVYRRKADAFEAITSTWSQNPIQSIADFDQDQLPDLVSDYGGNGSIQIWKNSGALNFGDVASLFSSRYGVAASADFDGDGVADVLGSTLYLGSTGMVFTPIQEPLVRSYVRLIAPADFDGDGVMDVAIGSTSSGPSAPAVDEFAVYRGQSHRVNHSPASPLNLSAQTISTNEVMLSWDRTTDPEQSGGLTYNVRVGTAPGLGDVLGPVSLPDGFRMVTKYGNAGWSTNRTLTALQPGRTYYWSVQAVDNSFAGGPFASEASFTMPAASLGLNAIAAGQLELELHAAPGTVWRLEASSDLKYWCPYVLPDLARTGTNGIYQIRVTPAGASLFYRATLVR